MRPASTGGAFLSASEVERVVAEQAADSEQPDLPGLAQGLDRMRTDRPQRDTGDPADAEGDGGQLKRRHGAARRCEDGEEGPQQDGAKPTRVAVVTGQPVMRVP
jgi:hypothetical protein